MDGTLNIFSIIMRVMLKFSSTRHQRDIEGKRGSWVCTMFYFCFNFAMQLAVPGYARTQWYCAPGAYTPRACCPSVPHRPDLDPVTAFSWSYWHGHHILQAMLLQHHPNIPCATPYQLWLTCAHPDSDTVHFSPCTRSGTDSPSNTSWRYVFCFPKVCRPAPA